jgi:hypothetical protein
MNDTTQTLLRAILKIGAGWLGSKGYADESTLEMVSAGLMALAGIIWGIMHRKNVPPPPAPVKITLLVALGLVLGLSCGCAYLRSTTTRTPAMVLDGTNAPTLGFQEKTTIRAYTLFDSQSALAKFSNKVSDKGPSGTTIAGLEQSATTTNAFQGAGEMLGAALKAMMAAPK